MELEDKILAVLGLIVVIGYGYSMDMVQALEAPLRGEPCNFSSMEINLLYFSTYLPVMITDIPLGIVLDKFPLQKTVLVIGFSCFLAELFTAILFDFRPDGYLYMIYALKAVAGMAGSSAFTMQGFIMARYAAQNFELMMGFGLSIPYIFDAINVTITPYIYDSTQSISLPWYIASFFDFLAVIAAVMISVLVARKERRIKDQSLLKSEEDIEQHEEEQEFKASYLLQLPKLFWIIISAMVVYEVVMCVLTNLNDLLINRFAIDYVVAGYFMLIPYLLASVLALVNGRLLKLRPTIRRSLILLAPILQTIGLIALYFLPNNSTAEQINALHWIVIVAFLISMSIIISTIYTVLGSSVSLLADKRRLGTAWGVIGMAIGLGESIGPIINGLVQKEDDLTESYTNLTLVYLFISVAAIGMALWIFLGPFQQIDMTFFDSKNKDDEETQRKLRATITTENQDDSN